MPLRIDLVEELKAKEKRNKNFALAAAYSEQVHQELADLKNPGKNLNSDLEKRVDKLCPYISNQFDNLPLLQKKTIKIEPSKPAAKEIASIAPFILGLEKTAKTAIAPPVAQIEPNDDDKTVPPPEGLEEEAPVADANPETVQRQTLWEMWQKTADELELDLQDLMADPFESKAANKMMLLCSHLASQMNHESARALLDFIEETRIENLKKSYTPGWKEWTPIVVQLLGAAAGGFCGFYSAGKGLVGSAAKSWDTASNLSNNLVAGGARSFGEINNSINQGKQSVVRHELDSDTRLQQDLQQRRQQAEQAAKRELENIVRMAQAKHETARSINQ